MEQKSSSLAETEILLKTKLVSNEFAKDKKMQDTSKEKGIGKKSSMFASGIRDIEVAYGLENAW